MPKIIIDYTESLTRIAILSEGCLTHMYLDTPMHQNSQNRIVVGQVDQVVKNLNGAFVAYGEPKNGLLHLKQVPPALHNRMQQGARIPVQIKKEHTGDKGHKLTAYLDIQGYYLVCMLYEPEVCLSKKIRDSKKRTMLKEALLEISEGRYGFMVRTKAQDVPFEVLEKEARYLIEEADRLMQMKDYVSRGTVLRQEDPLYLQVILEHIKQDDTLEVITNSTNVKNVLETKLDALLHANPWTYRLFDAQENLFKLFSIEKAFDQLFKHKIWLKNGGNIVIDYTEAMTVIDVNSAKAILSKNQQKATKELNKLAIEEGISQVLQRNLAGIIVMDLIDLKTDADKQEVFEHAKKYCAQYDAGRMVVYPLTELGLLQMTRTKKYHSVPDLLQTTSGTSLNKHESLSYVLYALEDKLRHLKMHTNQQILYIHCNEWFYHETYENGWQKRLEDTYQMTMKWVKNKDLTQNTYEIKYHSI